MIRRHILSVMLAALVALAGASDAFAASVPDQLQLQTARVIRTLEDPALKGSTKAQERHRALREATEEVFDWAEMARRALGGHWDGRSGGERAEFTALFRDLIERADLSKVERYGGGPTPPAPPRRGARRKLRGAPPRPGRAGPRTPRPRPASRAIRGSRSTPIHA